MDPQPTEPERESEELPDWVPDHYDPDSPLRDRLPIMAKIDGGVEVRVGDDDGSVIILGKPLECVENGSGTLTLKVGGEPHNWKYEIVVPAEGSDSDPFVRAVSLDMPEEKAIADRETLLENIDVRVFGVDTDRLNQ